MIEENQREQREDLIEKYFDEKSGKMSIEFFNKYIQYAKLNCFPRITLESKAHIIKEYVAMRKQGISQNTITATPRQLESIIRISEALAKMRLSQTVEPEDVR